MTRTTFECERLRDGHAIVGDAHPRDWIQVIRAEYLELPGLSLTALQAQRLWSLDAETCQLVLNTMVGEKFLRCTADAQYVRAD